MSATEPALYGLLGYPLGHTLSPAMHQAALDHFGLDGTYMALPVPPERLSGAIAGVRAWRLPGLNVTVPHKEAVIPLLDGLTPQARELGAVNTLYWEGDRLWGDNTDYAGFKESLPPLEWAHTPVTVLGAGGSARAVVAALRDLGVPLIRLVARRSEQARAIRDALLGGRASELLTFEDGKLAAALAATELLVNTTPVGMDGASSPLPASAIAALPDHAWVYDLIYNPAETPLLAAARARGLQTRNGLEMLVGQAAHAFFRWTGRRSPHDLMREAALARLERTTSCSAS